MNITFKHHGVSCSMRPCGKHIDCWNVVMTRYPLTEHFEIRAKSKTAARKLVKGMIK